MRIVFLHHANVCRGGIERMLATKANQLTEQMGWEVMMLTYEQNGEPYPYALSPKVRCTDLGVRLYSAYRLPYPMRYFKKRQLRRQLTMAIRQCLTDYQPDIVICTDKDSYEQQALYRAHSHEKLVIEAHTGVVDHEMQVSQATNIFRQAMARWGLQRLKRSTSHFDALIALTDDDARSWSSYVKTVVIPNCLPCDKSRKANLSAEHRRVIAVGRLNYQKGHDLLLQAWKLVEQKHPDWHLDIFGDGTMLPELLSQMQSLQINNVTIHPSTPNIYDEYQESDFLVCSSRWESFGLVLIEAMSCGIPVVSFDCDNGPRSIVSNGIDGLLAEAGDVAGLARQMVRLIENKALRMQMGEAACTNVERFRKERVFDRFVSFCKAIIPDSAK